MRRAKKLFRLILEFLKEENVKKISRLSIFLNRLEPIGLLEDKNVWLELRKIRNIINMKMSHSK